MTKQQIVASYGPQGPAGDGADVHIADLLRRTVDGQWRVMQSQLAARDLYIDTMGPRMLQADLSVMALLFAQRLALLRWSMATVFLDSAVAVYRDEPAFPEDVYQMGDTLCDQARHASRQAVEAASQHKDGSKVRLIAADSLDSFKLSNRWLRGTWSIYKLIASTFDREVVSWKSSDIPERYNAFVDREIKRARPHLESFRYLESEWRSTQLPGSQVELIREGRAHIEALFVTVQRLWAPYLFGGEYAEARKRPSTLAEIGVQNPWILTDPQLLAVKKGSADDEAQLNAFWAAVNNPQQVAQLAEAVNSLVKARRLRRRTGRGYGIVPWPSQFLVRRPFDIDGTTFAPGDLVAVYAKRGPDGKYDVSLRRTGHLTHLLDLLGIR